MASILVSMTQHKQFSPVEDAIRASELFSVLISYWRLDNHPWERHIDFVAWAWLTFSIFISSFVWMTHGSFQLNRLRLTKAVRRYVLVPVWMTFMMIVLIINRKRNFTLLVYIGTMYMDINILRMYLYSIFFGNAITTYLVSGRLSRCQNYPFKFSSRLFFYTIQAHAPHITEW